MLTRVKPKLVSSGGSRFGFSNFQRHSGLFCYVNHLAAYANPKATRAFAHLHPLSWDSCNTMRHIRKEDKYLVIYKRFSYKTFIC